MIKNKAMIDISGETAQKVMEETCLFFIEDIRAINQRTR